MYARVVSSAYLSSRDILWLALFVAVLLVLNFNESTPQYEAVIVRGADQKIYAL